MKNKIDVRVSGSGGPMTTVYLLTPLSQAARDWCAEHLPQDGPRLGLNYAVETRFVGAIVEGMVSDGLTVA